MIIRISILIFWILLGIIMITSCSPERRLHRLLALHPELVQNDTIRIQDTTILPGVKIDTLVLFSQLKDTVTITKEKLQVKLYAVNDTVYFWAEQESDTVVITKEIAVERVVREGSRSKYVRILKKNWIKVFCLLGGLMIISWFFKKF